MFWADKVTEDALKALADRLEGGKTLVIRDEKTASGRVHVGSLRSAAMHGIVAEILSERGIPHTFYFEINDFDPMDGLPTYLDRKIYEPHMGKPLYLIPSPDGKAKNFAEYFGNEYVGVVRELGFFPEVYRASELYLSGKMNDVIRLALERADKVRRIYKEVSGSVRPDNWFPLNVICESCGKVGTTTVSAFDGEKVSYVCEPTKVEWAVGCGHAGSVSPFDGRAKLPWKVEWAAKFKVMNVLFEGAGKDHYTRGGSRQVADRIAAEVFDYPPPYGIANEFFLVGGEKMSSSKGAGSSAREIADLIPPHILRLALFGKDINKQVNFDPAGDTIPVLYDTYDRLAAQYFSGTHDDFTRLFVLSHVPAMRTALLDRFLPRFSQVAFLIQMPHVDVETEVAKLKGSVLTVPDREELHSRMEHARRWLTAYAPEAFRFELKTQVPDEARNLSVLQKEALKKVLAYVEERKELEGQELHTRLHAIKDEVGISPQELFSAVYLSFLGKASGPKAGWFLSTLPRSLLEGRLKEVTA